MGGTARELGRISVNPDGSFQSEVSWDSSRFETPLPIGRQVLQVVGYDEEGNQTVVNLTINVAQGPPSPELNLAEGALPDLNPGNFLATSGGTPESVSIRGDETNNTVIIEGTGGWSFTLQVTGQSGSVDTSDDTPTPRFISGSTHSLTGLGFMPGTIASVWFFSDPTLVSTVEIDDNGQLATEFLIDSRVIPIGEHTLQLQGVGEDGLIKAANVGVIVFESESPSGPPAPTNLWWFAAAFLLVALLVAAWLVWRRRTTS